MAGEKGKYSRVTSVPDYMIEEGIKELDQANEFQDIVDKAKMNQFIEKDFAWVVFSSKYYFERHSKRWIPREPGKSMLPENKDRFIKNVNGVVAEVIRRKKAPWMYEYIDDAIKALTQLSSLVRLNESELRMKGTPESPVEQTESVEQSETSTIERRPVKEATS